MGAATRYLLGEVANEVAITSVRVARGATIVQAPAVALVDKVVGVTERDVIVLVTALRDVANEVTRASVGVAVGATEIELEAVTLVGDEVRVAV